VTSRIVVLNPKGGSGKTTVATSLAAYFAANRLGTVLTDHDPQGSSTRWLRRRSTDLPPIHGIAAFEKSTRVTRSFLMRLPTDTRRVVIDTPAALTAHQMPDLVHDADAVLVPVLPSEIDIHACSRCIADLLLVARIRRREHRIGVVVNRARRNTLALTNLLKFLGTLEIPVVATLRDSQNYLRAAETGQGLHDMRGHLIQEDLDSWRPLTAWLDARCGGVEAAARMPAVCGLEAAV